MYRSLNPGMVGVRTDLAGTIRLAKEHGFEGVDLPLGEVLTIAERDGVDAVARQLHGAGLRPGMVGLPVDWRGEEPKYRDGLEKLPGIAQLAKQLGATRFTTVIMPGHNELNREQLSEQLLPRLRPVARALAEQGCRLGLEFIGPKTSRDRFQHIFLYTAGDVLAFARLVGPNVGLLHDCWHWYTSGGTLAELASLSNSDVVAVHLNDAPPGIAVGQQIDNQRMLPMESGVIDLPGYLRTLHEIGYDGPVTVEPFSARLRALPPDEAITETAAALRRAWAAAGLE